MSYKIVQISDIHCGDKRFSPDVLKGFISRINKFNADMLVVAGDLTAEGYEEQFQDAVKYINKIKSKDRIIIPGNHDYKNVGNEHFHKYFGPRYSEIVVKSDIHNKINKDIRIMAVDSSQPDIGEGWVGRNNYNYIDSFFRDNEGVKILVLHHHLVAVPNTGRERNVIWDAGDLISKLTELKVDIVLSGHKHVPNVWNLNNMKLISSGTAGTYRTRGNILPSINFISITEDSLLVETIFSDGIINKNTFSLQCS